MNKDNRTVKKSDTKKADSKKSSKSKKKKKGKKSNKVLAVLITIIVILLGVSVLMFWKIGGFEMIKNAKNLSPEATVEDVERDDAVMLLPEDTEQFDVESIGVLRDEGSLSAVLKTWATSTDESQLMRSHDVKNFLFAGIDNGGSNSDVMMLVSVNTKTKKIYLSSVMRDSYTYIDAGKNGDIYFKLNSSYYYGGINKLIETFQNDFKIKIDHYATVNFGAFATIVDLMGGVNMDVEYFEAVEIDKTIKREYSDPVAPCPYGTAVKLDGVHALTFCRIRHCYNDADVHRTLNQRKFISAIIDRFGDISATQAVSAINTLLKYIKTDLNYDQISGLVVRAAKERWYNYEIVSSCFPEESERLDYSGRSWVWIVDYPAVAQKMQQMIYGETNITLSENRRSAIDIMRSGNGNTGAAAP